MTVCLPGNQRRPRDQPAAGGRNAHRGQPRPWPVYAVARIEGPPINAQSYDSSHDQEGSPTAGDCANGALTPATRGTSPNRLTYEAASKASAASANSLPHFSPPAFLGSAAIKYAGRSPPFPRAHRNHFGIFSALAHGHLEAVVESSRADFLPELLIHLVCLDALLRR